MTDLKALTVKQPWAAAIINDGKNVENRSRPTNHRGRLYIHAGLGWDKNAVKFIHGLTRKVERRHYVRNHRPVPQLVEMFHRYQCRFCHSWIYYDEVIGSWWHWVDMHKPKYWTGSRWTLDKHPHGMNDEEWQRYLETYR